VENRDPKAFHWKKSEEWITRQSHQDSDLIQTIRHDINLPSDPFAQEHVLETLERLPASWY
jgi:hypothetical protein